MGPACREAGTIEEMIKNGMNVARLNFSHGDYEYHGGSIKLLKEARNKLHAPLAIMLDTKGPEIRLGNFEKGGPACPGGSPLCLPPVPQPVRSGCGHNLR